MFRQISAFVALVLLFAVADVNGADVVMDDTWCDDSLPIYAKNMVLNCGNEGDGCTMGKSAGIYGKGKTDYMEWAVIGNDGIGLTFYVCGRFFLIVLCHS